MAKIKGPKKTNRYPDEFKVKAVLLANHNRGRSMAKTQRICYG